MRAYKHVACTEMMQARSRCAFANASAIALRTHTLHQKKASASRYARISAERFAHARAHELYGSDKRSHATCIGTNV